jgi:hypothetical protein
VAQGVGPEFKPQDHQKKKKKKRKKPSTMRAMSERASQKPPVDILKTHEQFTPHKCGFPKCFSLLIT